MIGIADDEKYLKDMKFIDLFAGIGGFRLALESLGAECVYSNEWEKYACETYKANFGEVPDGDITKVNAKDIPDHDILCAGFPCFPAGAQVLTDQGFKAIEKICVGDMVLTHKGRYRKVVRVGVKEHASTIVLRGIGNCAIECTPNHPFLSSSTAQFGEYEEVLDEEEERWTAAEDMVGKKWLSMFTDDGHRDDESIGKWLPCLSKENGRDDVTVYNMEVEEDHSYTVDGLAVHNCQAFSVSGLQRGFADTRGTLFFDVARIIREKKPAIVFMENVKNFAAHDGGRTILVIQKTMEQLGYSFDFKVLNAADFGAPTARERCYMVCFRNDLEVEGFKFPVRADVAKKYVKDILEPESETTKAMYVKRPDMVFTKKDIRTPVSHPVQIGYVAKGRQGERIYSIKGTAITLSAHGGGCFAKTGGYLIKSKKVRKLTPRECARVMGFPESFTPHARVSQAHQQFGNSVVVDVLQYVAKAFAKAFLDSQKGKDAKKKK